MSAPPPAPGQGWVEFFAGLAGIGVALGGVAEYLRRRAKAVATAWRKGDAAMAARITEFSDAMLARIAAVEKAAGEKLDAADLAINRRITDLSGNTVREFEAMRERYDKRHDQHDKNDDERFGVVHGRLDAINLNMARRDDQARIEGKIDQLLLKGHDK